jgi:flagellar biosynthesis protein FliQ
MGSGRWIAYEGFLFVTPEFAVQLVREAMITMFWLSAPFLLVAFATGIVISLVQIVTSIQDSAFSVVPRLAFFLLTTVIALPWVLHKAMTYATGILGNLSRYAN